MSGIRCLCLLLLSVLLCSSAPEAKIIKEYYPNGNIMVEMNLELWKPQGPCKTYYESGKLMMESNYKDGEQEGPATEYYESGKIKGKYIYKKGVKDGVNKTFYETGELMVEDTWQEGKALSKKVYFVSGKIKEDWDYRVSNPDFLAMVKYYDESGKLLKKQPVKKKKKRVRQATPKTQQQSK